MRFLYALVYMATGLAALGAFGVQETRDARGSQQAAAARLRAASKEILRIHPNTTSYPFFEYVEQATDTKRRGLYFNLGRVQSGNDLVEGDIAAELIRHQVWLDALEKSLGANTSMREVLSGPLFDARITLNAFVTDANFELADTELQLKIRTAMQAKRTAMRRAVERYAASKNLEAILSPDQGLGGEKFEVAIASDPPGAAIGYLPIMWAVRQMVRKDAEFPNGRKYPQELKYMDVGTTTLTLSGPYVFKAKWSAGDTVHREFIVKSNQPITVKR